MTGRASPASSTASTRSRRDQSRRWTCSLAPTAPDARDVTNAPQPSAQVALATPSRAEQRGRSALAGLDRAGAAITFAAVARHAGVSREIL
jgi:hypothetical protein